MFSQQFDYFHYHSNYRSFHATAKNNNVHNQHISTLQPIHYFIKLACIVFELSLDPDFSRQTDAWTDAWTDRRMDGQKNGETEGKPIVPSGVNDL